MNDILAAFAVPDTLMGTPPEPRTRWERGSIDLEYWSAFSKHFDLDEFPPDTMPDAQHVYMRRAFRDLGIQ